MKLRKRTASARVRNGRSPEPRPAGVPVVPSDVPQLSPCDDVREVLLAVAE